MSDLHVVYCGPCSREGTKVSSPTRFCVNCNESLCDTCMKHHQKFTSTRNHTFVKDPPKSAASSVRSFSESPSVTCSRHVGKVLESFCTIHDDICCSVCVAIDHNTCRRPDDVGIVNIDNAARGITESSEFGQICSAIEHVTGEVESLKSKREENLQRLSEKKNEIVKVVVDFRQRMNDKLIVLERATQSELGEVFVNMALQIETDIDLCNDVSTSLQTSPILSYKDTSLNDTELFIHMKKVEKQLTDGKKIIESVGDNLDKEMLEFKVNETLERHLNQVDRLGKFVLAQHSYKAVLTGEYKISQKFESGQRNDVQDCCFLQDGRLVIILGTEKKLKVLDKDYHLTDQIDLPGKPYGVCVASSKEMIVSLKDAKLLQFVNISGKTKLTKVMKVGVECYGVTYSGGEIFVACGGGVYEAKPQLRVYNGNGVLIRIIEKGANGKQIFSAPRNISLNNEGTIIYISDMDRGIVTFDIRQSIISGFWHRRLKSPRGLVVDEHGDVIVCGHHSHNVMQFTSAGNVVCTILTDKDSISSPLSICLKSKTLVVTCDRSKFIKVFALT